MMISAEASAASMAVVLFPDHGLWAESSSLQMEDYATMTHVTRGFP